MGGGETDRLRQFAANAGILTCTSLSLGAAGVLFNAWLTRNIGAEGMGLYGLMMAVYRFAVTFASAGAGLAATRLVAEEHARGSGAGMAQAMKKTVLYSVAFGMSAMALLLFLAEGAAALLVDDMRAAAPFRVLACSLPFVAVSGALGGWFTAVRRVAPASAAMVFEQLSQMAFTMAVFALLRPDSLGTACVLVAAGSTVSEAAAFILHYCLYLRDVRRHPPGALRAAASEREGSMASRVLRIGLPVAASNCLRSALSTVKHLLVPASLEKSGLTQEQALAEYGTVGQMVLPVLLFPCAFLLGFSSLLVPEMAEYRQRRRFAAIRYVIEYVFRVTLIFSVGVAGVLVAFGDELGLLLYGSASSGASIRALAPIVTVMYLDSAVDGILKGLGQQVAVVRYNVYDTALCVGMVYVLLPMYGVPGYLAVIIISEIFNMVLSAGRLVSVASFRVDMARWALLPAISAACAMYMVKTAVRVSGLSAGSILVLPGAVALSAAVYYALLRAFGCIKRSDIALAKRVFARQPL